MGEVKITNNEWSVGSCHRFDYLAEYTRGVIATDYGFVGYYQQWRKTPRVTLEFIKDGVMYQRIYWVNYSERYAITLAKRFAREIYET